VLEESLETTVPLKNSKTRAALIATLHSLEMRKIKRIGVVKVSPMLGKAVVEEEDRTNPVRCMKIRSKEEWLLAFRSVLQSLELDSFRVLNDVRDLLWETLDHLMMIWSLTTRSFKWDEPLKNFSWPGVPGEGKGAADCDNAIEVISLHSTSEVEVRFQALMNLLQLNVPEARMHWPGEIGAPPNDFESGAGTWQIPEPNLGVGNLVAATTLVSGEGVKAEQCAEAQVISAQVTLIWLLCTLTKGREIVEQSGEVWMSVPALPARVELIQDLNSFLAHKEVTAEQEKLIDWVSMMRKSARKQRRSLAASSDGCLTYFNELVSESENDEDHKEAERRLMWASHRCVRETQSKYQENWSSGSTLILTGGCFLMNKIALAVQANPFLFWREPKCNRAWATSNTVCMNAIREGLKGEASNREIEQAWKKAVVEMDKEVNSLKVVVESLKRWLSKSPLHF
jgi:hypothetical protein